jgi:hypothetical protein
VGIWANNMGFNHDDIANTCEYKWTNIIELKTKTHIKQWNIPNYVWNIVHGWSWVQMTIVCNWMGSH